MSEQVPVAHLPVVPQRQGLAVGATVFGLIAAVVIIGTSQGPLTELVLMLIFAVPFGLLTWWISRGRAETQLSLVIRIDGPVPADSRGALVRGGLHAALLAVAEAVTIGALAWWMGPEGTWRFLPGILLGMALMLLLEIRDLRRWQESNGLELFTRSDGPRIAFTSRQAVERLVAVAQGDGPVLATPSTEP